MGVWDLEGGNAGSRLCLEHLAQSHHRTDT